MSDFQGSVEYGQTVRALTSFIPNKTSVDLAPKLDITGNLFKLKDSNIRLEDKLLYNNFLTRLYMSKGTIASMPNMGFKDYLYSINFNDKSSIMNKLNELEDDIKNQMGKRCEIESEFDEVNKIVSLFINLDGLNGAIKVEYESSENYTVKIIGVELVE